MGVISNAWVTVLLLLVWFLHLSNAREIPKVFDVTKYGAVADNATDNAKAFSAAWKDACQWTGEAQILIPVGMFFLSEVTFLGPCKGYLMSFILKGTLLAPKDPYAIVADEWVIFRYVEHLSIIGGGTFNGQGQESWRKNDCRVNPSCRRLPMNVGFQFVKNAQIQGIKSLNSKGGHFNLYGCDNLKFIKVIIKAPEDSPNTDGIKVGSSNQIRIERSVISTGDDCVALLEGCTSIYITRVTCGPGHGISIGSLGKYKYEKNVTGIYVRDCRFLGTTNGVRIKTWAPSISQITVSDVHYKRLCMANVFYPILIDQWYCPYEGGCTFQDDSNVRIQNIQYENIWGTTSSDIAVRLNCSGSVPCEKIKLHDISLINVNPGVNARTLCSYVNGESTGKQLPPSCL